MFDPVNLSELLNLTTLSNGENFCAYVLRTDGWPWGYIGSFGSSADVIRACEQIEKRRSVIGLMITKESDDGTKDEIIFRTTRKPAHIG